MNTRLDICPKRGEVWYVVMDPTVGAEMQKTRPFVVLSSDSLHTGGLPLRTGAPITSWKPGKESLAHVRIKPSKTNGLKGEGVVSVLQLRGLDVLRFRNRIGRLTDEELQEVCAGVAALIEYV